MHGTLLRSVREDAMMCPASEIADHTPRAMCLKLGSVSVQPHVCMVRWSDAPTRHSRGSTGAFRSFERRNVSFQGEALEILFNVLWPAKRLPLLSPCLCRATTGKHRRKPQSQPSSPWFLVGNGGMDPHDSPLRSPLVVPIPHSPIPYQEPVSFLSLCESCAGLHREEGASKLGVQLLPSRPDLAPCVPSIKDYRLSADSRNLRGSQRLHGPKSFKKVFKKRARV